MEAPVFEGELLWPPPVIPAKEGERINVLSFIQKAKESDTDEEHELPGGLSVTREKLFFPSSRYPDLSKSVQKALFNDIRSSFQEQGFNVSIKEYAKAENKEESDRNTPRMRIKCTAKGCPVQFQFNWDTVSNRWFIKCGYGNFDHDHSDTKQKSEPGNCYCDELHCAVESDGCYDKEDSCEDPEKQEDHANHQKVLLATEKPSPVSVTDFWQGVVGNGSRAAAQEMINQLKEFTSMLSLDGMSMSATSIPCNMSLNSSAEYSNVSGVRGLSSMYTCSLQGTVGTFPASTLSATASHTVFEDHLPQGMFYARSAAMHLEGPHSSLTTPQMSTIPDASFKKYSGSSDLTFSGSAIDLRADVIMADPPDGEDEIMSMTEPPHPAQLLSIARNSIDDFEEYSDFKNLCQKIDDNATWCCRCKQEHPGLSPKLIIDVLLDATRSLVEIHHKGSPSQTPDPLRSLSNATLLWKAWDSVAAAWKSSVLELEPENMDLARELLETYQHVQPYASAMEPTVTTHSWPAMIRVRKEACNALPKAEPSKFHIHQQVIDSFEVASKGELAYGDYRDGCIPMAQTFVNSNRSGEYTDLAVTEYCQLWNRSMLDPLPARAWNRFLYRSRSNEAQRKAMLSSILGVTAEEDQLALNLVFIELETRFQYAFEDTVDTDRQLGLDRHRS